MDEISQRNLTISKFLSARALELSALLPPSFRQTKQSFQHLPHHMRRRAMSHNKYRIPAKLRHDLPEPSKLPKCRKHLRKKKLLIKAFMQRGGRKEVINETKNEEEEREPKKCFVTSSRSRWLETHLWQVKRMKMVNYWGLKVGAERRDKGRRAAYRFWKHDGVVSDISFFRTLLVQGEDRHIQKLKENYLEKRGGARWAKFEEGEWKWRGKIMIKEDDWIEVEIIFKKEEKGTFLMIVHPCGIEDLIQILKEIGFNYRELDMNIFHIMGPKSLGKLYNCLQTMGLIKPLSSSYLSFFSTLTDPSIYPRGKIIYIDFEAKLKGKLVTEGKREKGLEKEIRKLEEEEEEEEEQIKKEIIRLAGFQDKREGDIGFWKKCEEDIREEETFKLIPHSRYTHKRKLKKKEENAEKGKNGKTRKGRILLKKIKKFVLRGKKFQIPLIKEEILEKEDETCKNKEEDVQLENNMETEEKEGFNQDKKIENKNKEEEVKLENNMETEEKEGGNNQDKKIENTSFSLLISFENDPHMPGLKLMLPFGRGATFLRYMNFSNLKVVALREYHSFFRDRGIPVFPEDYPETKGFKEMAKQKESELILNYFSKPVKSRPNYVSLNFPYPFLSNFAFLHSPFSRISFKMLGKGLPKERALLCLPTQDDLNLLLQRKKEGGKKIGSLLEEEVNKKKEGEEKKQKIEKGHEVERLYERLREVKISRKIVGFVTWGGFWFQEKRGGGIGTVDGEIAGKEDFLLLMRNPTSRYYFFVECNRIN